MNIEQYHDYLSRFNSGDYDGVISYFTEDCEIHFGGYALVGHQAIRDFYAFFHTYVQEFIEVSRFVSDGQTVALEASVRLTGKGGGTQDMLDVRGLGNLAFPGKSEEIAFPQFIHYHLRAGKFTRAICIVSPPPTLRLKDVKHANSSSANYPISEARF